MAAGVQALLDRLVAGGEELGLQVAAYHRGRLVIDAWAGVADPTTGRPVNGDTLFTVFSVSKGIAATAIHRLVARGTLDFDAPIARSWPEFAARGKRGITLRHALLHTAGVPQMPPGIDLETYLDWDRICAAIADLAPLWPPGERLAYHALTYGWLIGEPARRVDGRPFGQIVAEEIASPLGLDGLFFGLPPGEAGRMATHVTAPELAAEPPATELQPAVIPPELGADETVNRPEARAACIPAANASANARSLARHYAALIGDGVDGVRLLSPARVAAATAIGVEAEDAVSLLPDRRGLGYMLGAPGSPMGERPSVFGHAGYGGAIAFADPEHDLAMALTKNRLTANLPETGTTERVVAAVRHELGLPA